MKKLLIPAFMILFSCVNDPIEDKQDLMCPADKEIDRLEVEFVFSGPNPTHPKLELDNVEVDYCYSGDIKVFCLNNIQTSIGKIVYSITAWKTPPADIAVTLFDGADSRISRTSEVMTSKISRP